MKVSANISTLIFLSLTITLSSDLTGQQKYLQATFSHGTLTSKKLNNKSISNTSASKTLPILFPSGKKIAGRNNWNGFGLQYGYQIKNIFWIGLNMDYSNHQFWFNFSSATILKNTTYFYDNILNIKKLSFGPSLSLSWQYLDVSLTIGKSFNHQKFVNGTSRSLEHFQTVVLENQPSIKSSNIFSRIEINTKIPLSTSGQLIFGGQIIAHKQNQLAKSYYEISYNTFNMHLGYRYTFSTKMLQHEKH